MSEGTNHEALEAIACARHAWAIMNEDEKSAARIGRIPRWALLEDFGGKAGRFDACWRELTTAKEYRLFAFSWTIGVHSPTESE